ncbi:MAG: low molecular weight protein-tyrosine-phosphatase [Phycisphaerales bacterium JB037]
MSPDPGSVLFVCLGNICRSPMAEAIFLHKARERGVHTRLVVDSAGTGAWHVGNRADPRTIEVAGRFGIEVPSIARQVRSPQDFDEFHWIIAMDRANHRDLLSLGAAKHRVHLMRSFDRTLGVDEATAEVPDPYYGEGDGFLRVFEMLDRACDGLLDRVLGEE